MDFQKELNDLTECPLCLDVCVDPRTLPCHHHHWTCRECISKLIESVAPVTKFNCPSCREEIKVPPGGAVSFPAAFLVNKLITLAATKTTRSEPKREVKCEHHEQKRDMFCETCKQLVCSMCCVGNHKGHSKLHVDEVVEKYREMLYKTHHQLMERVNNGKTAMSQDNDVAEKCTSAAEQSKQHISAQAEKVIQLLQQAVALMHGNIDAETSKTTQKCKDQQDKMALELSACNNFMEEIESTLSEDNAAVIVDVCLNQLPAYQGRLAGPEIKPVLKEMTPTLVLPLEHELNLELVKLRWIANQLKAPFENIVEIQLRRASAGLGIVIGGGAGHGEQHISGDNGIFVTDIINNGAADLDGRLAVEDRLLMVGNKRLENVTHGEAAAAIKNTQDPVMLVVAKHI